MLSPDATVMDFGAGTGLVSTRIASYVGPILAVDVSPAMLERLSDRVEIVCQDLLRTPLDRQVDLVVSAMAAHHVDDTAQLMRTLFAHLTPGGTLALADLDAEDGRFHPPDIEGVFHHGFDRSALGGLAQAAGFVDIGFSTACHVTRDERSYPIFLLTARRPAIASHELGCPRP